MGLFPLQAPKLPKKRILAHYDCFKFQAYMSACESDEKVKISTIFRARLPQKLILVQFARERSKCGNFEL